MVAAKALHRRPEARAETVEELVEKVVAGLVRVPSFQRGLKWKAKDVVDLLDSVYRGYPIGSLLLWQRPAEAKRIDVGPLVVPAPETQSALWVVDGQQRLTAFAASLARRLPLPTTPVDPYVVYFDPETEGFQSPPVDGDVPTRWVAVPHLLDAARLSEWVLGWLHVRDDKLRQSVFEAGKRLREYRVPLYVVDTDDERILREIFHRVNKSGQRLQWSEIHDALYSSPSEAPSTLSDLATALDELGMGRVDDETLLQCLLAMRGLDVTQNLGEHHRREAGALTGAVVDALPVLRRTLSFLRASAEVPHVRLLPRVLPLIILVRFFALHKEPNQRTRQLLTRWVWRLFMRAGSFDERTMLRHGVRAIEQDDEEKSAQRLLLLTPPKPRPTYLLPRSFDARSALNRVVLLALTTLRPRHLATEEPLDIAAILQDAGADSYRAVLHKRRIPEARTAANRLIHPAEPAIAQRLIERYQRAGAADEVLASHAISVSAARALAGGDDDGFLRQRGRDLTALAEDVSERCAGWSRSDRPSISHLLAKGASSV